MEGESLGIYQLKTRLGQGGMGSVYRAHDPRLARDVALKILSPELAERVEFRDRFVTEARACSALKHPNITTIHDIGEADGRHFIAFELVEGDSLEALLQTNERLSVDRTLEIVLPLVDALQYAHERGIVHRDLKPANVVLSERGEPKILDFGLAKAIRRNTGSESATMARLTQAGTIVGTIAYMAPEQAMGHTVDARSDVFSLGCVLYEMLCGVTPFTGANATQVLDRLLHQDPAPLRERCPRVPEGLARAVMKTLHKKPEDRHQSMAELSRELQQVTVNARPAPPSPSEPSRVGRRPRRLWVSAAVAIGLAASAVLFLNGTETRVAPGEGSVAVMYFHNLTDPSDEARTGRMMTELLTSELSSSEDLHVVSRQRLYDVAKGLGHEEGDITREIATDVAEAAGVQTMIVGQIANAGDRLLAATELVDVGSGRSLSSQRTEGSSASDIFQLADSLADQVQRQLQGADTLTTSPPHVALSAGSSVDAYRRSVDAYRHYVEGEMFLHASELDDAVESFRSAIELAPEFALAHFRLSMAARWLSDGPLAHQAARRAAALVDNAPDHLRELVQANALYQDGAYSQALPLLEATLARNENQKEALYIASQIYVHSLRDGDTARAIELMETLLASDPAFHQVYDRLALSHAFMGRTDRARDWMEAWKDIRPDKVEGLRSILATLEGQPEEALGFGQAFSWIEGPLFQSAAAMMASRWDVASRMVQQDVSEWRSEHLYSWALRNRAVYHTYVGEFDRALEYYRQAGMASGFRTHEGGNGGVPASALQLMADLLYVGDEIGEARSELERALSIQPESWRGLYFAGRMALRDDDAESAERYYTKLMELPATRTSASASVYARALEGELLLHRGEAREARELFTSLVEEPLMLDWSSTCSSAGAAIRDGLVRSHLALGDTDLAAHAMEGLLASGAERLDHAVLYVRTLYRLGVVRLDSGDEREGRRLLTKFLEHWGDADWELDIVHDARARLQVTSD